MGLQKEGILALKMRGFPEVERAGSRLAAVFAHLQDSLDQIGTRGAAAFRTVASGASPAVAAVTAVGQAADAAAKALRRKQQEATGLLGALRRIQAGGSAVADAITGAFGRASVALAGAGVAAFGVFKALAEGEKVQATTAKFERLAQATGGSSATLQALERATGGAVAKSDLMASSNRLLQAQLGISRDRMETLFAAAIKLGAGEVTASEAVSRLSLALAKQEPELLDEIGLKPDLTKAISDYAEANGIAVGEIDAQTRSRIFLNAVEKQAAERSAALGITVDQAIGPTQRLSAQWKNLTNDFAVTLTQQPGIFEGLKAIGEAAIGLMRALTPVVKVIAELVGWLSEMGLLSTVAGAGLGFLAGGPIGAIVGAVGGAIGQAAGGGALSTPTPVPAGVPLAASGGGGAGIVVNQVFPVSPEGVGQIVAKAQVALGSTLRSGFNGVQSALERDLRSGLDSQFAGIFMG